MVVCSEILAEIISFDNPKTPETSTRMWYVNEKFLLKVKCYESLKKS